MTAPHLLVVGFYLATLDPAWHAFPSTIQLLEPWPQDPLPSATIIFFDNNGHFISINDVDICQHQESVHPLVSQAYDTVDNTLFGTMCHYDTSCTSYNMQTLLRHYQRRSGTFVPTTSTGYVNDSLCRDSISLCFGRGHVRTWLLVGRHDIRLHHLGLLRLLPLLLHLRYRQQQWRARQWRTWACDYLAHGDSLGQSSTNDQLQHVTNISA